MLYLQLLRGNLPWIGRGWCTKPYGKNFRTLCMRLTRWLPGLLQKHLYEKLQIYITHSLVFEGLFFFKKCENLKEKQNYSLHILNFCMKIQDCTLSNTFITFIRECIRSVIRYCLLFLSSLIFQFIRALNLDYLLRWDSLKFKIF